MSDNPYEVLGVGKDATDDEINAAFRKAAKQAHPDQDGSTEEFQRVKNASLVLLDPERRKRFDDTGKIDGGRPDNHLAEVMEAIATFFVSSLDALDNPMAPRLADVNLVEAARTHFGQQVAGANQHIKNIENKVKKFERAIKRLKTKREDDLIGNMLTRHVSHLNLSIENTKRQVKQFELAITILKDYEFESESTPFENPYLKHIPSLREYL